MSYLHVENLYKNQDILMFRECYALEKIHGTSAHVAWKDNQLVLFSGGSTFSEFEKLFDKDALTQKFAAGFTDTHIVIFGEAYGGKLQGMRDTYGPNLRFIAFEVKIGDSWLSVPVAEEIALKLGF